MRYDSRKSIQQIVNEQVQQWLDFIVGTKTKKEEENSTKTWSFPCSAISRQRGSGSWRIGRELARCLDFKFF